MSGGHATTAGIEYQAQVGAWFASHILTSQAISEIGPSIPTSFQMESISPVDDIVVNAEFGGLWFINVKTDVSVSTQSKSTLSSVADQFVRQWIEGVITGSIRRDIDPSRDRLILVVKPNRSRPLVNGLNPVIKRFIDNPNNALELKPAYSEEQNTALNAFSTLIKFHWSKHTGLKASEQEIIALISCVRVIEFELTGTMRAALGKLLEGVIEAEKTTQALDAFVLACIDFSKTRSGGDAETLKSLLSSRSIFLKIRESFQRDIQKLIESTDASLRDMCRYSTIFVRESDTHIPLRRQCTQAIIDSIDQKTPFLVIGDPGAGKSGALFYTAKNLLANGQTVLIFQVDQLTSINLESLQNELTLNHSLLDILREWRPATEAILIIDALDASRGTGSEPAIRALITQLKVRAPHWTIVASIRKFDLRYGKEYQTLFAGSPVNADFNDPDFPNINHINIPKLSVEEIAEVRSHWPNLDRITNASGSEFQSLLSSPFNLYLLGRIITDQSINNPATTQLDLLSQFWEQRVEHGDFLEVEEASVTLESLLRKMLAVRRLTVNHREIPDLKTSALEILLRNGVLYFPFQTKLVSFSHHMLFDFALARLVFIEGQKSIGEELSLATNDILLVAPAIMLALRMIWEEDPTRCKYWNLALQLGNDSRLGPFVRALPSRVAAEAIKTTSDVLPLIQALSAPTELSKETASLLLKHLLNVLLADVISNVPNFREDNNPWCEIVALSANASIKTLQWPINTVINTWIDKAVSDRDKSFLGEAARILMLLQLTDETSYHEASIAHAIKTTVKTFESNPKESERLIRKLLEPSRVIEKGHRDLFWLAHEFSDLSRNDAKLAADFLVAAFTSPLPSKDEDTSLGNSRILSLRSNKKQDFESVLYALKEKLSSFIELAPAIAGTAFKEIVSKGIKSNRHRGPNGQYGQVSFTGTAINFWQDHSCIWWGVDRSHYDSEPEIVQIFYTTLSNVSDTDFETILLSVLQDDIPAVVLAACMRAGTSRSNPGNSLELVFSKDVLSMMDTSYDAAQLLSKHFSYLSQDQKDQLQDIIDSIDDDDHRKLILLSCIPPDEIITNPNLIELKEKNSNAAQPRNEPHFKLESGWSGADDHYWLKSKGIDTESTENKSLLAKADSLKIKDLSSDNKEALIKLKDFWEIALSLLEDLSKAGPDLPVLLKSSVYDSIAEVITEICERADNESQLTKFPSIRDAIDLCLRDDLNPPPVHDAEREKNFEESYGWGRPAPRIVAASALMSYVKAYGKADELDSKLILKLARDPAVEIRHSILSRANMICLADQKTSKTLAFLALTEENNEGVLSFFLNSFHNYLGQNIDWAPQYLFALSDRLGRSDQSHRNDSRNILTVLILSLWFNWEHSEANNKINDWISDPLTYRNQVTEILVQLRGLVANENNEESESGDARLRLIARDYFYCIVKTLADLHKALLAHAEAGTDVKSDLTDVTRMLDSAALQLYHGSGAYSQSKKIEESSTTEEDASYCRFLENYIPSLKILAGVPYPSVTHPVLEIIEVFMRHKPSEMLELYFAAAQEGGKSGGYHYESMGADLVVKIARKYLADYPGLIAGNETYRQQLLEVLNNFAEIGWPEARKLVYQLPEMLR